MLQNILFVAVLCNTTTSANHVVGGVSGLDNVNFVGVVSFKCARLVYCTVVSTCHTLIVRVTRLSRVGGREYNVSASLLKGGNSGAFYRYELDRYFSRVNNYCVRLRQIIYSHKRCSPFDLQ